MSRYLFVFITLMGLVTINSTIVNANEVADGGVVQRKFLEEKEARKIAEKYFLEFSGGEVEKYEIILQSEWRRWVYFISGIAEFKHPANNWIVEVNGVTGQTVMLGGEKKREEKKP